MKTNAVFIADQWDLIRKEQWSDLTSMWLSYCICQKLGYCDITRQYDLIESLTYVQFVSDITLVYGDDGNTTWCDASNTDNVEMMKPLGREKNLQHGITMMLPLLQYSDSQTSPADKSTVDVWICERVLNSIFFVLGLQCDLLIQQK